MNRGEHGGIFFRFLNFLVLLALLALLYVFRHPIMRIAGEQWIVSEPVAAADVIVVLGDDNYTGDRAAHAAELFHEGLARQVAASGRALRPGYGMADLIAQDLEHDGVPAGSVVKFSYGGDSLRGEVESLQGLVESHGWKRILVVTSNYETRPARFFFEREFPADFTIRVSAAADRDFDPSQWWHTSAGQRIFLGELGGYLLTHLEEWRH